MKADSPNITRRNALQTGAAALAGAAALPVAALPAGAIVQGQPDYELLDLAQKIEELAPVFLTADRERLRKSPNLNLEDIESTTLEALFELWKVTGYEAACRESEKSSGPMFALVEKALTLEPTTNEGLIALAKANAMFLYLMAPDCHEEMRSFLRSFAARNGCSYPVEV